jgi:two-component sensor histidine kinase
LNGPIVTAISDHGFGRIVLEKVTPAALGGEGTVTYAPEGIIWMLRAPITYLEATQESG